MIVTIIQSRMGSTRLPNKAAEIIDNKPSLAHVIERAKKAGYPVFVATTDKPQDDEIEAIALKAGVNTIRLDDENNVLRRYYSAAILLELAPDDVIVRVTADCLGLDPEAIKDCVSHIGWNEYAYASRDHGYTKGYGCEAFTMRALTNAYLSATSDYDKEHVTPWIQRNYPQAQWKSPRSYPDVDMELNTPEDLQRIRNVYEKM